MPLIVLSVFVCFCITFKFAGACDPPPKFSSHYARVRNTQEFPVGTEVEYVCRTGFVLRGGGDGKAKCITRNGQQVWDGPTIQCRPVTCAAPPIIENGKFTGRLFTFGSNVTYSCNSGYEPSTNRLSRFCLPSGKWGGPTPACNPISCPVPGNPPNGKVEHKAVTFGEIATYTCDPPFAVTGQATRRCLADKTWSGSQPSCKEVKCRVPSSLPRGKVISHGGSNVGDIIYYVCDDGDIESSAACKDDGSWSPPPPSCPDNCKKPPTVENGVHDHSKSTEEFSVNTKLTYSCNKGCREVVKDSVDNQALCSRINKEMVWIGPKIRCTDCNLIYIIVGTVAGAFILGMLPVIYCCWARKRKETSAVFVANGKKEPERTMNKEETINLNERV